MASVIRSMLSTACARTFDERTFTSAMASEASAAAMKPRRVGSGIENRRYAGVDACGGMKEEKKDVEEPSDTCARTPTEHCVRNCIWTPSTIGGTPERARSRA